jgi:hypothetical protein
LVSITIKRRIQALQFQALQFQALEILGLDGPIAIARVNPINPVFLISSDEISKAALQKSNSSYLNISKYWRCKHFLLKIVEDENHPAS